MDKSDKNKLSAWTPGRAADSPGPDESRGFERRTHASTRKYEDENGAVGLALLRSIRTMKTRVRGQAGRQEAPAFSSVYNPSFPGDKLIHNLAGLTHYI